MSPLRLTNSDHVAPRCGKVVTLRVYFLPAKIIRICSFSTDNYLSPKVIPG